MQNQRILVVCGLRTRDSGLHLRPPVQGLQVLQDKRPAPLLTVSNPFELYPLKSQGFAALAKRRTCQDMGSRISTEAPIPAFAHVCAQLFYLNITRLNVTRKRAMSSHPIRVSVTVRTS